MWTKLFVQSQGPECGLAEVRHPISSFSYSGASAYYLTDLLNVRRVGAVGTSYDVRTSMDVQYDFEPRIF